MRGFSEKEYLNLNMPTEEVSISDQKRIQLALQALGYENVTMPLSVLRMLYPMCREANFDITVTLVYRETDWIVVNVEPGDQRHTHYGLAVDYGSTTIIMQLIDMNSGAVIAEVKAVNGQRVYGTDILSRITYSLEDPSHMDALRCVHFALHPCHCEGGHSKARQKTAVSLRSSLHYYTKFASKWSCPIDSLYMQMYNQMERFSGFIQ